MLDLGGLEDAINVARCNRVSGRCVRSVGAILGCVRVWVQRPGDGMKRQVVFPRMHDSGRLGLHIERDNAEYGPFQHSRVESGDLYGGRR
jgi:hypothetical protein